MSLVLRRAAARHLIVLPIAPPTSTARGIITWIPAGSELKEEIDNLTERMDRMGADPYPRYRKEHRKTKEVRFDVHNKWKGRISQHKVRGLVEFIEYKRANKYQ
jgi:hypothetical protein